MIIAWRIVKPHRVKSAFTGRGAMLSGNRWNSIGISVVYSSESCALAQLEALVHLPKFALRKTQWVVCKIAIPNEIITSVDISCLPKNWNHPDSPDETKKIGDRWILERTSAVLRVPSAPSHEESNYLINPRHKDFYKINIGQFKPFKFDPRLEQVFQQEKGMYVSDAFAVYQTDEDIHRPSLSQRFVRSMEFERQKKKYALGAFEIHKKEGLYVSDAFETHLKKKGIDIRAFSRELSDSTEPELKEGMYVSAALATYLTENNIPIHSLFHEFIESTEPE